MKKNRSQHNSGVDCGTKQQMINLYYNNIINILNTAAIKSIPVMSVNSSKPFWSAEVQSLKEDSIQAHKCGLTVVSRGVVGSIVFGFVLKVNINRLSNMQRLLLIGT